MADFKRITNTNWYLGASTDTKPGAGTCPIGSTCYETDTGALYITADGGTTWTAKPTIDGAVDVLGTTAGAAVVTDTTGTIQQYLRGLIKLIAAIITVKIDQTTPGTTNAIAVKSAAGNDLIIGANGDLLIQPYTASDAPGDARAGSQRIKTIDAGTYAYQMVRQELYNGTTWDRPRSVAASGAGLGVQEVGTLGELITLAASAARTESANGTAVTGLGWRNRYIVLFDLTVADTDAGDTLDVYVDVSLDGNTWLNAVHFTQIIGTDAASKRYAVLDPAAPGTSEILVTSDAAAGVVRPSMFGAQMRARWAITDAGADDASFTFSVTAYAI